MKSSSEAVPASETGFFGGGVGPWGGKLCGTKIIGSWSPGKEISSSEKWRGADGRVTWLATASRSSMVLRGGASVLCLIAWVHATSLVVCGCG